MTVVVMNMIAKIKLVPGVLSILSKFEMGCCIQMPLLHSFVHSKHVQNKFIESTIRFMKCKLGQFLMKSP